MVKIRKGFYGVGKEDEALAGFGEQRVSRKYGSAYPLRITGEVYSRMKSSRLFWV
jgi:hypothetical protein